VSREEFLQKIQENFFLEYDEYCEAFYGTPAVDLERDMHLVKPITVEGIHLFSNWVKEKYGEQALYDCLRPILIDAPLPFIARRLQERGDTPETIVQRLKSIEEAPESGLEYFAVIKNEDGQFEASRESLLKIMTAIMEEPDED
jgi:guanylate kinase